MKISKIVLKVAKKLTIGTNALLLSLRYFAIVKLLDIVVTYLYIQIY